jgi:outer membrane immunogenic protein
MKKIGLAVALVAAGTAVPALAAPFQGFHAGVEIGRDNYTLKVPGVKLSGDGIVGGVFGGYDFALGSSAFVGVEAKVDLSGADLRLGSAKAKAKTTYGASVRGGFKVNDSTGLYARVGWDNTRFSGGGYHKWEDGIQYGGGIQTAVSKHVDVRVEYAITDYGSFGLGHGVSVRNNAIKLGASFGF